MGRQGHDTSAPAPGVRIQRSPSKMSLSASFEALAVYFPCMNSFDEEDGGKITTGVMLAQQLLAGGQHGIFAVSQRKAVEILDQCAVENWVVTMREKCDA